jgi:hypothetical protein
MGLFDTPAVINKALKSLNEINLEDFPIDVIRKDEEGLLELSHDFFESPCFFQVTDWVMVQDKPCFKIKFFPRNCNELVNESITIASISLMDYISSWCKNVLEMISFQPMYENPKIDSIRKELQEKLGLSPENAEHLLNEVQKSHALQYLDQVAEILNDLEAAEYDPREIEEIKFDLEKIKRDIVLLRIKTQGELGNGITRLFSKVKVSKGGTYLLGKAADWGIGKMLDAGSDSFLS